MIKPGRKWRRDLKQEDEFFMWSGWLSRWNDFPGLVT